MPTAAEPHNANPVIAPDAGLAAEDLLRAQAYRLLARFLSAPPQQADLDAAAALEGDDGRLGRAISAFARIARRTTPAQAPALAIACSSSKASQRATAAAMLSVSSSQPSTAS